MFHSVSFIQVRVIKKILDLYTEYHSIKNVSKAKQTSSWREKTLQPFLVRIENCLDISCGDQAAIKKLEQHYKVKMTQVEQKFLCDQLGPRLMLCTTEVDR